MQILLSATNALIKWLKPEIEWPRIPSADGKRIGTQPLITHESQISWQCHVIQNGYRRGQYTVIATEAHSRYTLLMPFVAAPTLAEFENELLRCWINDLMCLTVEAGALTPETVASLAEHFVIEEKTLVWYRNTDLSVNGHVGDAEQWTLQFLRDQGVKRLSEQQALDLADHINKQRKKAKNDQAGANGFVPVARLVDDGLFRFAQGLSPWAYPDTKPGDFPNPYGSVIKSLLGKTSVPAQLPDNVVCLNQFRNKKALID